MAFDLQKFKLQKQGLIPLRLWNDLVDVVHSGLITSFVGGAYARTATGTALWARGGGDGGAAAIRPLQILLTSETTPASGETPAATTTYLSLYPGTVGGVYPKVDGQFLWAMPSDGNGGFLQYPRMAITLPIQTDPPVGPAPVLRVWLKVHCLAGSVVGAECETGISTPEVPLPPPNSVEYAYVLLGFIRPDGSIVQQTYGPLFYLLVFALNNSQPFGHTFS